MSRSHRRGERTSFLKRVRGLRYLIVLVTGGLGVGGWQLKDHPLLQQLLQRVTDAKPGEPLINEAVLGAAVEALEHRENFRAPGEFEVKVATVKIDPALIRAGSASAIQVRVSKRDARGHASVVWDSKNAPVPSGAGSTTGWPDAPFRVEWAPGDQFTVDVWQGRGLLSTKHFEWKPGSEDAFPLRSGAQALTLDGMDQSLQATDANQIVFQSRRVAEPAARTSAGNSAPARDEDTIVIK